MPTKKGRILMLTVVTLGVAGAGCSDEPGESALARQIPAVDAAQERVGAGGPAQAAPLRRLWAGEQFSFYLSSPSPDGRYVTETDWSTGNLAVRDLHTGRLHHLTDKGSFEQSGDYPEGSRFSPDGRRVAYSWYNEDQDMQEVRVMDFVVDEAGVPHGSDPRVVHPGPQVVYWLYGWSPDDELLTGVYRPDNTFALAFLSLSTGSLRVLKSFDWREARAALSADGRFIAYDHPSGPDSEDRDVYLLSADGQLETKLFEGPGNDVVLGWMPGDGSLLIYSERSGTPSVWRLPMSDGQAVGPAQLVREDVRKLQPFGFAGEAYYFGVIAQTPKFRTATIDFEGRRLLSQPMAFDAPYGGMIRGLAWSPDGEYVVHDAAGPADTRIYVRTVDGEVIREWNFDLQIRPLFHWAPDASAVFLPVWDDHGRQGIYRIDLQSGELETVRRFAPNLEADLSFSISPDGRSLYFAQVRPGEGEPDDRLITEIVEHDLATGTERLIHRVREDGPTSVSPDGAWLVHVEEWPNADQAIRLFPVDGGDPRVLHRVEQGGIRSIVGWTPDAGSVLFLVALPAAEDRSIPTVELWRVSREGGDAERITEIPEAAGVIGAALHPDGRTVAFRAGRLRGEIWALDPIDTDEDAETQKQIR